MSNEHYETIDDTVYNIYEGMQLSSVTRKDENHWHIETGSGYFMNLSVIDRVVIADLAETEYTATLVFHIAVSVGRWAWPKGS